MTRTYLTVFATLIVLTLVTTWVASVDLGPLNTPIALGIASCKALLVVLYFMHVRHGSRLVWLAIGGGLAWLAILIVITLSDYMSRGWMPFSGQ